MIALHNASCVKWLAAYDGPLFDSCVTDPPYELGFMGKAWDSSGVAFSVDTWRAVYNALKPGAHLVAFSGTRTYHRMACAIEDAGFEIRDMAGWLYGSGFPKSLDISKAIDKAAGAERAKVRVSASDVRNPKAAGNGRDGAKGATRPWIEAAMALGYHEKDGDEPATDAARQWQGYGTALKPAQEPICIARKPLSEKTVAANVLKWGTGALNIDGCRVAHDEQCREMAASQANIVNPSEKYQQAGRRKAVLELKPSGRWPANIIHDGSDEVLAVFPETGAAKASERGDRAGVVTNFGGGNGERGHDDNGGSAARFFYSAKAGPLDRIGTSHATVKPVDTMRWLARLVTPKGGHILEPFAGSGTTGIAAMAEGFDCTMIELLAEHCADIERKLAYLRGEGASRIIEHSRHKRNRDSGNDLPLFAA